MIKYLIIQHTKNTHLTSLSLRNIDAVDFFIRLCF